MPREERGLHRVIFLERNCHRTQMRTEVENVQGKNAMRTQKRIGHQLCEEPDAGKPHVRFCRGAGPARGQPTRQKYSTIGRHNQPAREETLSVSLAAGPSCFPHPAHTQLVLLPFPVPCRKRLFSLPLPARRSGEPSA